MRERTDQPPSPDDMIKITQDDSPRINLSRLGAVRKQEIWADIKKNPDLQHCVEVLAPLARETGGEISIKLEDLYK